MMKILILDTDILFLKAFRQKIQPYFKEEDKVLLCKTYNRSFFETNTIDIIFLAIDLGVISGIEVAKELKQLDHCPIIIFVSSSEKYIHQTLSIQPLYVIRKTNLDQDIKHAITLLHTQPSLKLDTIEVGGTLVNIHNILYIESDNHNITFHFINDLFNCRGTLEAMSKRLATYHFIRSHRSYVLNIRYVDRCYYNKVILKTGERLVIGRKYHEEVKQMYKEYRLREV